MEPNEFLELREGIDSIIDSLGKFKIINKESKKVISGFSHSVVSTSAIKKGEKLIKGRNIWYKRLNRIPANNINLINGKKATRDIKENLLLKKSYFK